MNAEDNRRQERDRMVREQIEARHVRDPRVLRIMREVPRHRFVPSELQSLAYSDHPLPIDRGQTISQPYIVALMSELARVPAEGTALDVGTGSGYQAAILSRLCARVFSIERIPELSATAAVALANAGCLNVELKVGDGWEGWPEQAPFDVIVVTAAPETVPEALLRQLKPHGRLVIPVGPAYDVQRLLVFYRRDDGRYERTDTIPVRFVPLVRNHPHR